MATVKDKFINASEGYLGVITLDARGERSSIAVAPGDVVWLTEEEQALTANAPRSPEDNPFTNGKLQLEAEGVEMRHQRPLRPTRPVEETGAAPAPTGDAETGSRPAGEEVGTPDVADQAERAQAVRENVEAAAVSGQQQRTRARPKTKA